MAYRHGDMVHTDNYKCRIGDHSECGKYYNNEAVTSPTASDLDQQAKEIADSAVELHTNDEIEELASHILAFAQAAVVSERERIVGIVEGFGANIRKVDLLAAITAED